MKRKSIVVLSTLLCIGGYTGKGNSLREDPLPEICEEVEIYRTPMAAERAFEEALPAERWRLYVPALIAVREKEAKYRQCLLREREAIRLRPGEGTFGWGVLSDTLPGGYLHKLDVTFLLVMKQLIEQVEGGITSGRWDAAGKRIMRPTNRGVEDTFYRHFRTQYKGLPDVPVSWLSKDDTQEILYRGLWKHYNLDKIKDPAVAALVFDSVLNSGHRAISNLVGIYIPRDVLGLRGEPTTFGSRAANILNAITEWGTPCDRDGLLIHLLRQRRHILETAAKFSCPVLGVSLRFRLRQLERYTRSQLSDPDSMARYLADPSTRKSHGFFRDFKLRTGYDPETGRLASSKVS